MARWIEAECPDCGYKWNVDRDELEKKKDVYRGDPPTSGVAKRVRVTRYRVQCANRDCKTRPFFIVEVTEEVS